MTMAACSAACHGLCAYFWPSRSFRRYALFSTAIAHPYPALTSHHTSHWCLFCDRCWRSLCLS